MVLPPRADTRTQGIQAADLLVSVGDINASNHDSLRAVGALVGQSEGVVLQLGILRGGEDGSLLHLRLTPQSGWGGRGLLGYVCMSNLLRA